jgi:hypothetical protein
LPKLCFTILSFFVESANCYIAPLIFLPPKLFLLGKYPKYPRPYFVGVNVLMCAFFKNGERVCVCERESAREREEKAQSHTQPCFTLFSCILLPLSHSLFPPSLRRAFYGWWWLGGGGGGSSACARVCECVWASACACASVCVCVPFCAFNSRRKISFPSLLLCVSVSFSS